MPDPASARGEGSDTPPRALPILQPNPSQPTPSVCVLPLWPCRAREHSDPGHIESSRSGSARSPGLALRRGRGTPACSARRDQQRRAP
eukprot:3753399-Pyramimonas_sp.AAC.2